MKLSQAVVNLFVLSHEAKTSNLVTQRLRKENNTLNTHKHLVDRKLSQVALTQLKHLLHPLLFLGKNL